MRAVTIQTELRETVAIVCMFRADPKRAGAGGGDGTRYDWAA
jgi:hypothetical protein